MRAFQVAGHGGKETHARNAICVEGSCSPSQIYFPQVSGGPGARTFKLKKKKKQGGWRGLVDADEDPTRGHVEGS